MSADAYLSTSSGAWRVISGGVPVCADKPTREAAENVATLFKLPLPLRVWDGDAGQWQDANTCREPDAGKLAIGYVEPSPDAGQDAPEVIPGIDSGADFIDAVRERVEAAGFTFHERDDDESGEVYWFCWCGPDNAWDVETGPDCEDMNAAIVTAVDALATFMESADAEKALPAVPDAEGLPPDPEGQNGDRAEWARSALRQFQCVTGTDYDDVLPDLLTDLMHLCDRDGFDFARELERAQRNYKEETHAE